LTPVLIAAKAVIAMVIGSMLSLAYASGLTRFGTQYANARSCGVS